jgi:hypothetical protein
MAVSGRSRVARRIVVFVWLDKGEGCMAES